MIRKLSQLSTIALALCVIGCRKSVADSEKPQPVPEARSSPQATPTPSAPAQSEETLMSDIFTGEKSMSYNGFNIATIAKSPKGEPTDLSYAVIKKKGRAIARFGNLPEGGLDVINFGLFPLLGSKRKQLIISQTVPRGGRHWIVELAADAKVLFDSGDYEVGREEVWAVDIEGDGVYEIELFVTSFYGDFDQLSVMNTPLPTVIFSYDRRAG